MTKKICSLKGGNFCGGIINPIINYPYESTNKINWNDLLHIFRNTPGGTSTKNLSHWIQIDRLKDLRMYDYQSKEENQKHYGHDNPPQYDYGLFKNYNIESFVTWSDSDPFSVDADNMIFYNYLNEDAKKIIVNYRLSRFNHVDYNWSKDSFSHMNIPILKFLLYGSEYFLKPDSEYKDFLVDFDAIKDQES